MDAGKSFFKEHAPALTAFLVIVLALVLRCIQSKEGLPYIYNWDEPYTASVALQMLKSGDFNPHHFGYGSLMYYLMMFTDKLCYWYYMTFPVTGVHLGSLQDIKTTSAMGWPWVISPPVFYYWDRVLVATMGAATVGLVYLTGKELFNPWVGLIAAFFLAVCPYHIENSAIVTPNVPMALLFLCVVYFSVLFMRKGKRVYFVLSLIFAGLAIGTKMNAGLVILMPVFSLLCFIYDKGQYGGKLDWFLVPIIPAIVFLLVMPYALLDFPYFFRDMSSIYVHYYTGHQGATIQPGLKNFLFQMHEFNENIGPVASVLALIGLFGIFHKRTLALAILVPGIYALYMCGARVDFHRNFVPIYPFIAILIGSSFYYIYHGVRYVCERLGLGNQAMASFMPALIAVPLLAIHTGHAIQNAVRVDTAMDTRSRAVEYVNHLNGIRHVFIARSLHVHGDDLNKLTIPYSVQSIDKMAAAGSSPDAVYILPSKILPYVNKNFGYDTSLESHMKESIIEMVGKSDIKKRFEGGPIAYDMLSPNPGVLVVGRMPYKPLDPSFISFGVCDKQSPDPIEINDAREMILGPGEIRTPLYRLQAKPYVFRLEAGNMASGLDLHKTLAFKDLRLNLNLTRKTYGTLEKVNLLIYGDGKLIASKSFEVGKKITPIECHFALSKAKDVSASLVHVGNVSGTKPGVPIIIKNLMITPDRS